MLTCPTCQNKFHPHMNNSIVGKNVRNNTIFVYYQICPECREPIIGIKESIKGEIYLNPNDVENLVLISNRGR